MNLATARLNAITLAVEIELFTPSTAPLILSKAFSRARALDAKINVEQKVEEGSPKPEPPTESQSS